MKKQAGFTLIELAIVLVIIGLLLGGVLRGQELINSARVKSLTRDFQNIQVYLYTYQDRFHALPGDDRDPVNHVGGTLATTSGPVANGQIGGEWDSAVATAESYLFWQHVRLAGIAPGSTATGTPEYLPVNTNGARMGIQTLAGMTEITSFTNGSFAICSDGILGRDALQIDTTLDDGNTGTGSVQAVVSGTPGDGVAPDDIDNTAQYTVCMAI
ncbi:MAG TPA: prepilin-type N-terminal cleavage/methylation domain-containing protein [Methylotenera sp.]|nr:prepilin-type N-terminal cleavage/methylation domain-containing protein [Methylotenera sp.]